MANHELNLSVEEIQGHLRQMMETRRDLTDRERYSLKSAIESVEFLRILAPGLKKAVVQGNQLVAAHAY